MGYIIVCQAPSNHGKSTTIRSLCSELELMPSSHFETLYKEEIGDDKPDILRAYRRFGLLIYVISAGDKDSLIVDGYHKLQYACGGLNCDILVCAATKNKQRQHEKHKKIEAAIHTIAKENGHYTERVKLKSLYNKDDIKGSNLKQLDCLRKVFSFSVARVAGASSYVSKQ